MSNGLDLHIDKNTTRIGLLIAVLAAIMVLTQTAGENAQTEAISRTVQTSNLWAFFQAKTIRKTVLETAADDLEITALASTAPPDEVRLQVREKIEKWRALAATYESEPATGEGRQELMAKAKAMDDERAYYAAKDETFDIATGCLQIAILLASTAVITGLLWLAYIAGALGVVGAGVGLLAVFAPTLIG